MSVVTPLLLLALPLPRASRASLSASGPTPRVLSSIPAYVHALAVLLPLPAFGANHGAALAEESASASTGASAPAAGEAPSAGVLAALAQLTRGLPPTVLCKSGGEPVVTTDI